MKDLTQGPVSRLLVAMAVPIAIGMLFQTLYFLVDLYFVSRLGEAAIAGVSTAGTVTFIILALTQMLGELARQPNSQRLFLQGLTKSDITRFVASTIGTLPTETLAATVLSPEEVVARLITLANEAGGPDNIALALADITEAA